MSLLNPHFPGEYFDAESGLSYNANRDYEAATGRYLQSDPIGLAGGTATYAYVASSPFIAYDRLGLDLTPAQQQARAQAAQDWSDSAVPYQFGGAYKHGADCSGSISSIFDQARVPIGRMTGGQLANSPNFSPATGPHQVVDIGLYPGHVVLYGKDETGVPKDDVWSASHTGGPNYGPAQNTRYGNPVWYQYDGK